VNERAKQDDTVFLKDLKKHMREQPIGSVVAVIHTWNEEDQTSSGCITYSRETDSVTFIAVADELLRMGAAGVLEAAKECSASRELLRRATAARVALGFEQSKGKPS
jgi:hypothetical protein